jgi:hypothetical protein
MTQAIARSLIILIVLASPVAAQDQVGNLTVISNPPGTSVTLRGEYQLAGVTPVTFSQKLYGVYKLVADRGGYERYETTIVLVGDQPQTIEFSLVTKTRFKAAFRSLLIPGWGQMYNGQKWRGALYTGSAVLSLAALFVVDQDFRDKRDDYDDMLATYNSERSIAEKRRLKPILDSRQQDAYDAESSRRVFAGIAAFVWLFNVVDAAVFFPQSSYSVGGPTSISLDTGDDFDHLQVKFAVTF